jgi:hypothetical protein
MLLLAAAAMIAATPLPALPQQTSAVVQAQASVRIVSGARISLDGQASSDAPPPTEGVVHTEGSAQPARLIEFQ